MADSTIQLGIIGCGWAGSQAVQAAKIVSRTKVHAVADICLDRRQSVVKEFSVPEMYEDNHDWQIHKLMLYTLQRHLLGAYRWYLTH